MTLRFVYEAGLQATYEDITDRVRLYSLDVTQNAEEGSVALSSVTIDDPDGDYEIIGYRRLGIYEEAASAGSNSLLYHGFIVDRKVVRGPYRTGAGRQWVCSVADTNSYLEFRVMVGSDANRPAETDVARMLWLMTTSEMNRIADSTTYINTSNPVQMDAVDYRGQRAVDVLNDCAQASGKNYYAFALDGSAIPPPYDDTRHVWYDFSDSTARTSSIRLTNVNADIDSDPYDLTYAIADDTELVRSPSRVYSGAYVRYDGGAVFEEDMSTSNQFTRRDAVVPADNVKSNAKATTRARRYLAEMDTEEDRIRTAIRLPAARVNFVREGMRCQIRASHFPGYESYRWARVLQRTVKQDSEEEYLVTLELSVEPSEAEASSSNFLVAIAAHSFVGQQSDQSANPWTLAWSLDDFTSASVIACGAGPPANQSLAMYYRAIVPGESATVATFKPSTDTGGLWVYEIAGCDMSGITPVSAASWLPDGGTASVSASAASASVMFGAVGFGKVSYDGGWCTGWPGALVASASGTELVNKSSLNDCGAGGAAPWVYIGHSATGTGTRSISATANSNGGGAGAYACGYNVGRGGLLIPVSSTFSIVQSAFGGASIGAVYNVTLPSPPTP